MMNCLPYTKVYLVFINVSRNERLDLLQKLLLECYGRNFGTLFLCVNSQRNTLYIAVDLFNENESANCEILKLCIKYINAKKFGRNIPPFKYILQY